MNNRNNILTLAGLVISCSYLNKMGTVPPIHGEPSLYSPGSVGGVVLINDLLMGEKYV